MRKCCSTLGIVAGCAMLIGALTGCADRSLVKQTDIRPISAPIADAAIVLDAPAASGDAYRASAEDLQILQSMELKLENEHLQLYMGKFYDVAVKDKATGAVFFSNEAAYYEQEGWSEQRIAASRSQVTIEYYGSSNSHFLQSSYPYCLDDDGNYQVTVKTEKNQLLVTYQFGEDVDSKMFCRAMTKEAFESLEPIAQSFIEKGDLTSFEWRKFKGFYNHIEYDKLNKTDKEKYEESHKQIVKLKEIYVMQRGISETQRTQISKISRLLGIDADFIQEQVDAIDFVNNDENVTAFFQIPLSYELHGSDLIVRMNAAEIRDTKDFKLTKIYLLGNFGATKQNADGYVFLPDGSGVIVNNDVHNEFFSTYEFPFYGSDYGVDILEAVDIQPDSVFPVFGIRAGKRSVFGIVESGDAIGGVSAQIGNTDMTHNTASPWFTYYAQDRLYLNGLTSKDNSSYSFVYPETPNTDECRIRYHFLYGDNASYSGMARYYQKYLVQTGMLEKKTQQESLPLDLNFIGSIQKKKMILGVPVEAAAAASDFASIEAFMSKLTAAGVSDYHLTLEGALNGGMEYTVANGAKLQSVLGKREAYASLLENAKADGGTAGFAVDLFGAMKKGNGLVVKEHLAKYITKQYVFTADYSLPDYVKTTENQRYLMTPLFYTTLADNFVEEYRELECGELRLSTVGSMLYGDYAGADPVTRSESKAIVTDMLQKLSESNCSLVIGTGNLYTLKYADRLTEVPVNASDKALESYAVPFVGMVLHGYIDYSGPQLNQQGNYQKVLLENIRSGAGLNFLLMTADPLMLEDTKYSNLFTVYAGNWSEEIVSTYTALNETLGSLQDCTIVNDEQLAPNVYRTTYSDGTSVIVNFNFQEVETAYGTIDGMGYRFVD